MLSKRAIILCKIILQLTILTYKMYAILGGLLSGGLKSSGLKSAHRHFMICSMSCQAICVLGSTVKSMLTCCKRCRRRRSDSTNLV